MRLRIGAKTLFTMLAVAVPSLLLFSVLMIKSRGEILLTNITNQMDALTDLSIQTVQDLVTDSSSALLTIAESPDVQAVLDAKTHGNSGELHQTLARLETTFLELQKLDTAIQAIRYIDENGLVLAKVREGAIIPRRGSFAPGTDIRSVSSKTHRDFYRNTMELPRGKVWISNLERGTMEGEEYWCPAMVRFATPLFFKDNSRAGVLIINVWGQAMGTMISRLITPEEGTAFILEKNQVNAKRNGIYLFHQDKSCEFGNQTGSEITVFQDFPDSITAEWMNESTGISFHPATGDLLAYRYYSPYGSDQRGWIIVVNARKDVFMAPMAAMKSRVILSAGCIFVLMLAASFFFARNLTRPIRSVIDGTHRISRNLSSRIQLERRDEIGQLADEINVMAATLEDNLDEKQKVEEQICQSEKLASVGEMATGLSHELNTPLSNIKALATLARKDVEQGKVDPQALQNDMHDIISQIEKCSQIIGGLLGFARKQKTEFVLQDINDCIAKAVALVQMRSTKKGVGIRFTVNADLPFLKVDGHQIEQVCVNILLNGIDASEPGGELLVSTSFDGSRVALHFVDSGHGIAPEILFKIFNPFFTTKDVGKGTGLGLSLSYGIIKNHGGTIEVNSRQGKGSEFTVLLPTV